MERSLKSEWDRLSNSEAKHLSCLESNQVLIELFMSCKTSTFSAVRCPLNMLVQYRMKHADFSMRQYSNRLWTEICHLELKKDNLVSRKWLMNAGKSDRRNLKPNARNVEISSFPKKTSWSSLERNVLLNNKLRLTRLRSYWKNRNLSKRPSRLPNRNHNQLRSLKRSKRSQQSVLWKLYHLIWSK